MMERDEINATITGLKRRLDETDDFLVDLGIKLGMAGGGASKAVDEAVAVIDAFVNGHAYDRLLGGEILIARERMRQVEEEGHDPERDKTLRFGELALLACYYALWDCPLSGGAREDVEGFLRKTHIESLKPKDRLRNLVRAGALIAAEIDRVMAETEIRAKAKGR